MGYLQGGIREKTAFIIASFFFVGLMPFAPGTWGSIAAFLGAYFLLPSGWEYLMAATLLTAVAGIVSINIVEKKSAIHDDPRIVIDEVAGFLISILFLPFSLKVFAIAFVLFRLFDIWKPFPVGYIDKKMKGGLGVMLDDIVAGIFANLLTRVIVYLFL